MDKVKPTWADKKFGPVCEKCYKRHLSIGTPGDNLPKDRNDCNGMLKLADEKGE